jgi:uncharacterized protein
MTRVRHVMFLLGGTALLAVLLGCETRDEPWSSPVQFDTSFVWIHTESDSVGLSVEVAETASQQRFGLMDRPSLDPEWGMIFLYDSVQAPDRGMWMWRTNMPLDVGFIDQDGSLVAALSMDPCPSPYPEWCPSYPPGVPYVAALEVNRGWFMENDVHLGSRVILTQE